MGVSLSSWCLMGSAEALRGVHALGVVRPLQLYSAANWRPLVLLQHLAPRLRQLCRKETTCSKGASSE